MVEMTKFSELVGAIYEANLDVDKWASLALRVADVFSAESGSLQVQPLVAGSAARLLSLTENIIGEPAATYEQYYFRHDVYVQHAMQHGLKGTYLSQEAVAPSEVARSEFYTDWGKRTGVFHVVGGGVLLGPANVALLAVHRPIHGPMFDAEERRCLALLLPHIGRALQVAAHMGGLQAGETAKSEALARLNVGAIVVAANGTILQHNALAERLFMEGDGLCSVRGRLTARRHQERLQQMLSDCGGAGIPVEVPGGLLTLPRPGRAPLSVLVGRLDATYPGIVASGPAAIVFVHDPEIADPVSEAALMALYRFTAAEARLAAALAGGMRLHTFAERRGISLDTVKTQLRHVMAKTGTERQTDLVALLARNSVLRMAAPFG
jgi:DNA-binding CsgD family transcriptional regulator